MDHGRNSRTRLLRPIRGINRWKVHSVCPTGTQEIDGRGDPESGRCHIFKRPKVRRKHRLCPSRRLPSSPATVGVAGATRLHRRTRCKANPEWSATETTSGLVGPPRGCQPDHHHANREPALCPEPGYSIIRTTRTDNLPYRRPRPARQAPERSPRHRSGSPRRRPNDPGGRSLPRRGDPGP